MRLAVSQPDGQAFQDLTIVRNQLEAQLQVMNQIRTNGNPQGEAVLVRIRAMLQERLQWCQMGLTNPAWLRDQLRQREQQKNHVYQTTPTSAYQTFPTADRNKGHGNPWTTGTPTPGSGYGPGNGSGEWPICTPTGTVQGGNSWTTGTPTPGSGYGQGPGIQPTQPVLQPSQQASGSQSIYTPGPQPTSQHGIGSGRP